MEEDVTMVFCLEQWDCFSFFYRMIERVIYLLWFVLLLINSNKISAWLCCNDEAAGAFPSQYLFLLLLFPLLCCPGICPLSKSKQEFQLYNTWQPPWNKSRLFWEAAQSRWTEVPIKGVHPVGGICTLFVFNNAASVIGTQQWLHSRTSCWRKRFCWG